MERTVGLKGNLELHREQGHLICVHYGQKMLLVGGGRFLSFLCFHTSQGLDWPPEGTFICSFASLDVQNVSHCVEMDIL